jgi:hypothetical protein
VGDDGRGPPGTPGRAAAVSAPSRRPTGDPREYYRRECAGANVDYVPMDTSVGFDKALLDYLVLRQRRFG